MVQRVLNKFAFVIYVCVSVQLRDKLKNVQLDKEWKLETIRCSFNFPFL